MPIIGPEVLLPISRVLLPVTTSVGLLLSGMTSEGTGPFGHQAKYRAGQGLSVTGKDDGPGHAKPVFFCLSLWNMSRFYTHTVSLP